MSDTLGRIVFPQERGRLARLYPPLEGEADDAWLNRMVAGKSAVLLTTTDARDPGVYRARLREAAGRYLVVISDASIVEPPTPAVFDQPRYLAERRAGKLPTEAARDATEQAP